jgi:hypothetical protein
MADKPYTERTGGRYVRDPETGRRERADESKPTPAEPAASKRDESAEAGKGRKS